jgi:hypothetical protein
MHRRYSAGWVVVAIAGAGLVAVLAGCGGGGGDGGPAADVAVEATITVNTAAADSANAITGVIVRTTDPGDTFDIAGATARIERADGTSGPVPLSSNAARTRVTLGAANVVPSATLLNKLIIDGPVSVNDGATGTTTEIGVLEFAFEVLAGGVVVSPDTIQVNIPTRGAARNQRVTCRGLSFNPRDYVKTVIIDNAGGRIESAVHGANSNGVAILRDAQGNVRANVLSGANSSITMLFARTDSDTDGIPDLF